MSKRAAIDTAVRLQLYSEGKTPQYGVAMTDATLGGTAYTRATMRSFLIGVANRLKGTSKNSSRQVPANLTR